MDMHQNQDLIENPSNNGDNNSSSSLNSPRPTNNENLHPHEQPGTVYCEHVRSYIPGFSFHPTDELLVNFYLKKKVANEQLPSNFIHDVELYKSNPDYLAEKLLVSTNMQLMNNIEIYKHAENHEPQVDKQWYFFTPRERKYPNGERANRAAGDGYWKGTISDKPVVSNKNTIGFKKALVFYQGKAPNGVKTNWMMHEYRLNRPTKRKMIDNDMRLDDLVLCRIYKRPPSKNERKVEENEALIASSSQNHNSHNNNPNPHYPELQRINIHQNPNFMEHQHPPIPPLPPATYFQQHDPDSTNPNPDLAMDDDVFGGLEPLSPSWYLSTGITYEDIWN
ncbi:hypothetical protein FEM48_ZijujUnG0090900 [Ziziphus jujuba var. spinosa]|uniref:NAC domain-containing protein n=1 Tax=Ziziphus jujuba var. spinosa TaxID=714518 RepID=A0A978U8I4_ZIZJJ|nr:hypothetical protein FEM48_ZijujUnG0090900 [Ziziphus jujuba var. spinosa]